MPAGPEAALQNVVGVNNRSARLGRRSGRYKRLDGRKYSLRTLTFTVNGNSFRVNLVSPEGDANSIM